MSALDPALVEALLAASKQVADLNEEGSKRMLTHIVPQTLNALEPLFVQRQPFLDSEDLFWFKAITSQESPTSHYTADCDAKLLKGISSLRVTKKATVGDAEFIRRLTVVLKPNIFYQGGEVHREMRSDGTTVSCSNVQFKVGPQAVKDTILRIFDPQTPDQEAKSIFDAFDLLFQNPHELMN